MRKIFVPISLLTLFFAGIFWQVHSATRRIQATRALPAALKQNDLVLIRKLIEQGADPNTRENPSPLPQPTGWIERLKLLFWLPRQLGGTGKTPLVLAAGWADRSLVQTLLEQGANVHATDDDGNTALLAAAQVISVREKVQNRDQFLAQTRTLPVYEVLTLLLDHGAAIDAQDQEGYTALYHIAYLHNSACERLLSERGADAKIKNRFGNTALYSAVAEGRTDLVRTELDRGVSPNDINNRHYFSYLMVAAAEGYADIVRLLLDREADVNAEDDGQIFGTALIAAVKNRRPTNLIRLLLDHGAKVDPKDCHDRTALDWAIANEDKQAINLLKKAGAKK